MRQFEVDLHKQCIPNRSRAQKTKTSAADVRLVGLVPLICTHCQNNITTMNFGLRLFTVKELISKTLT